MHICLFTYWKHTHIEMMFLLIIPADKKIRNPAAPPHRGPLTNTYTNQRTNMSWGAEPRPASDWEI
jgi:hypothetical protein